MKVLLAIVALVVAASVLMQNNDSVKDAVFGDAGKELAKAKVTRIEDKISPHAVYPVKADSYPELAKKVGADGIDQINAMMQPAALKVAESPRCDKVEVVGVSDRTRANDFVLYVDCANMERYYINQSDLAAPSKTLVTQSDKAKSVSNADAIRLCESEIKPDLSRPNTFDRSIVNTSVQRHKTTGNLTVRFPFEASNKLNMALSFDATCVVSNGNTADVVITEG